MKLKVIVIIYFFISILFIAFALFMNAESLYEEQLEKNRLSNIQKVTTKKYSRQRKSYVPKRSIVLAQKEINRLLENEPIIFTVNNFSLKMSKVLINIVTILNNMKEEVVLNIITHTDNKGTSAYNLDLSQKRADNLKVYFRKRTNLPFVVAIGYGKEFLLKNSLLEISLQRIK